MRYANVLIESYSIVISFILAFYLYFHRNNMRRQTNWFIVMLVSNICMTVGDMTDWIFSGSTLPYSDTVLNIGMAFYFMSSGVLLTSYTFYLLAYQNLKVKSWAGILSGTLGLTQMVLGLCSPFAGGKLFFYVGADHAYHRGELFLLSQATAAVAYILQTVLLVQGVRKLQRREVAFLTSYIVLPVVGEVCQVAFYDVALLNVGATIAMLLIFINVQSSQELRIETVEAMARAKTDFLASMSHEIRTPINAVLGMNEIILRESSEENVLEYAENIKSASRKLLSIINDILDFSKIESKKMSIVPVPYGLSSLIHDLCNMTLDRAEKKGLSFRLNVSPEIPENLIGDEVRLNQIVLNLLTNAVKYTQSGYVELTVESENTSDSGILLKFRVKDSGIGIKAKDIGRLFDSFQRVDEEKNRSIEGTGLGLSIVKQLVELMGGTLSVQSVYGEGSEFAAAIPQGVLMREPIGDYQERIRARVKAEDHHKGAFVAPDARILAIDDNQMNLKVLQGLLKRVRVQLDLVSSGMEGIAKLEENTYDLIFLDDRMPHMDGMETFRLMRERNLLNGTPVIALTANAISGAREMYMQYGFQDYLSKPVNGDNLEKKLSRWLPEEKVVPVRDPDEEGQQKAPAGRDSGPEGDSGKEAGGFQELRTVLDFQKAMEYAGDEEEGLKMNLMFFCENYTPLYVSLRECFEKKEFDNYGIHAHALKSNAITIGATDLAELAREMEFACKENRTRDVEEKHGQLLESYRALVELIQEKGGGRA